MPQTIYGNQVGTETLRGGMAVTISVDAGSGGVLERFSAGSRVSAMAITGTLAIGPFISDMVLRVSANSGATLRIGAPVDQVAQRLDDTEAPMAESAVQGAGTLADISGNYGIGLGHSMVQGAGSTNAGSTAWVPLTNLYGNALQLAIAVNAGVAGETTAAIMARTDAVVGAVPAGRRATFVLLCLANDGDQNIATPTTGGNLATIISKIRKAGHGLVLVLDPPRRSDVTQTKKDAIARLVLEAYRQAKLLNVPTIDLWGALSDATGSLASGYAADDIHFNNAGHLLMFQALQSLLAAPSTRAVPRLAAPAAGHAVSNPLLDGTLGSNYPTNWSRQASSTVTPTVTLAVNTDGAGNQLSFTIDSTGGAATFIVTIGMAGTTWSAGDVLGVTYSLRISEGTGTWDACVTAGGSVFFWVMNGGSIAQGVGPNRAKTTKRWYQKATAPAGNGLRLWITQPAGYVFTYTVAEVDIINETALGIML